MLLSQFLNMVFFAAFYATSGSSRTSVMPVPTDQAIALK
jgi:hypothetical protein